MFPTPSAHITPRTPHLTTMQLARLCVSAARPRLACHTPNLLLHTSAATPSDDPRSRDINETTGTPGRGPDAGTDADVKFGDKDASPSSGELYGREDRDPMPSPNPGLTQANSADMSFPRDEPSRPSSEAGGAAGSPDGSGSPVAKEEGLKAPQAYPIQNDPTIPEGAGPELTPDKAQQLQQDESSGPKAAGQGVVEGLAKEDPERYGSDRSSPA